MTGELHRQCRPGRGGQRDLPVDARRLAASVSLRDPPHTKQRVRPAAQHQLLQVADPFEVPVLRRLEDPSPQPPYVVLDRSASRSRPSPGRRPAVRSPQGRLCVANRVAVMASNLPARTEVTVVLLKTHLAHVSTPRGRESPVSGQLSEPTAGGAELPTRFPVAFRRTGVGFLGHPVPAKRFSRPYGRPTESSASAATGFPRSACARPGRGGCRLCSGGGGVHATGQMPPIAACRFPTASPAPRYCTIAGVHPDEAFPAVHSRSPVRPSPHLRTPDGTESAWAFPPAPHPAVTGGARQGGDGT